MTDAAALRIVVPSSDARPAAPARYPSLIEINTRAWLYRLSREAGKAVTLGEVDDAALDDLARRGLNWIWLLTRAAIPPGAQSLRRFCRI